MFRLKAFTMAEILITLGIIGIIAAMTLPTIIEKQDEKANVTSLLKFASTISQAVNKYKADTECTSKLSDCLTGNSDAVCSNFDPIAKNMKIISSAKRGNNTDDISWLPDKAYNYYGEEQSGSYGGISKVTFGDCAYALADGIIFSLDINPTNFDLIVDVNGKKRPNRVGRDIFFFTLGGDANFNGTNTGWGNSGLTKDVYPYPLGNSYNTFKGTCKVTMKCNPTNLDPTKNNGASLTSYVLLTKKLPPLYSSSNH